MDKNDHSKSCIDSGLGDSLVSKSNLGTETEKFRTCSDSRSQINFNREHLQQNFFQPPQDSFSKPKARIDGYDSEKARFDTFKNWPAEDIVSAKDLAHFGLIYPGTSDRVKCVYCLGAMFNWDRGDDSAQEHTRHFPKCPLLLYFVKSSINTRLNFFVSSGDDKYAISYVIENWNDMPSVEIVRNLGYSNHILEAAKPKFCTKYPVVTKYFCESLLDILFDLEQEQAAIVDTKNKVREVSEQTEGATASVTTYEDKHRKFEVADAIENQSEPQSEKKELDESTLSPELQKLVSENKELKENTYCHICRQREANMLFLPCRHIVVCDGCSSSIQTCIRCDKDITWAIKIYLG